MCQADEPITGEGSAATPSQSTDSAEAVQTFEGLQIYGQDIWHSDAKIAGNRKGLETLRDQISRALEGTVGEHVYFPSDGEGFGLTIQLATDAELDQMPCWYEDYIANPDKRDAFRTLQDKVFRLEADLRKVRIHNREAASSQRSIEETEGR